MHICEFEDAGVSLLDPLTLTRPAFDLWCGTSSLLDRHRRCFAATTVRALVRRSLADVCRAAHPLMAVNDPGRPEEEATVLVNARWLPPAGRLPEWRSPQVALVGDQVAFVVRPPGLSACEPESLEDRLRLWKQILPQRPVGGAMINYPWDLVERTGEAIRQDWTWRRETQESVMPPSLAVIGPKEQALVHPGARVEPLVVADTTNGPVIIDRGAVVQAFSRLEGPCYVGPESWVVGARVRGCTIGPKCRVGGEVEASIVQGYSNKYHDGFLGHSYIGEWVNLAAGTQTSDLRNDYDTVRVFVAGQRRSTGRGKVGAFIGDHTKTALGALLNTGSAIGVFAGLLPSGTLLPPVVPSFCQVNRGQLHEQWDLRKLLAAAAVAMRRRGRELTEVHKDLYYALYERTVEGRRKAIREGEIRRLRRSV
jgi:UDP-N-acetylglucosamine diphosphorylase / glucose-1-phosphate thymidylyltransferase / UDP-N-acetylgalactosamine diphosphorylase / glucosamine-1-phosphate N-acetyltransferase / galactosamine-1-phosphate N-acetyltransferase